MLKYKLFATGARFLPATERCMLHEERPFSSLPRLDPLERQERMIARGRDPFGREL